MKDCPSCPKISVLMPVYNVEKYLPAALDSVLNQTLSDIELICVDDASTDNSADILRAYAAKDPRVKLVFHEKNSGLVMARKSATELAQGEYIMLLDSDDEYELDACETVWKEEQANPVDILQFGTDAVICRPHEKAEEVELQKVLSPYKYVKDNLVLCCYEQHLWNHTVWNKAYKASVWKAAIQNAVNAYINISEDEYLFFLVSYFSTTYRGVEKKLYRYYYARGMTGTTVISGRQYESYCQRKQIYEALETFLKRENCSTLLPLCKKMASQTLENLVYEWRYHVSPSDARAAYQYLISIWGAVPVISEMAQLLWNDLREVANRLAPDTLPVTETSGRKVHTIAVFYHRMGNGGVEHVISYLIPLWEEMGYSVVLVTEKAPSPDDYSVPTSVPWVQLPSIELSVGKEYKKRATEWARIIADYDIDTIVYNTANVVPLWDICLLKALSCNFVVDIHSTFSSLYILNDPNRFFYAQCYRLVDRVATLSRVFVRYWGNFCPAYYIPNPLGEICPSQECSSLSGKNLLWVGRISAEKRPEDAIRVFKQVHDHFSDATLTIVGKGEKASDLESLKEFAHNLKVADYINFAGYHKDIGPYYREADLLLFTSQYEGFPLVLAESKMHCVPIVMYDLPYVEMARDGAGIFTVPQQDVYGMASVVIRLLEDKESLKRAGLLARKSLSAYSVDVLKTKWAALFDSFISKQGAYCAEEDQKLMMGLLLDGEQTAIGQSSPSSHSQFISEPLADRLVNSKFQQLAIWYWKYTDPLKEGLKRLKKKLVRM